MPERRMLDFASMDEIMPDVERLLEGHSTAGQWTLAQILYHLATSIRLRAWGVPDRRLRAVPRRFGSVSFAPGVFPRVLQHHIPG
jgi:Protein of unknown function (DUF1569)